MPPSHPAKQKWAMLPVDIPAVVIDGEVAGCCASHGVDEATLRAAGVGQPLA